MPVQSPESGKHARLVHAKRQGLAEAYQGHTGNGRSQAAGEYFDKANAAYAATSEVEGFKGKSRYATSRSSI